MLPIFCLISTQYTNLCFVCQLKRLPRKQLEGAVGLGSTFTGHSSDVRAMILCPIQFVSSTLTHFMQKSPSLILFALSISMSTNFLGQRSFFSYRGMTVLRTRLTTLLHYLFSVYHIVADFLIFWPFFTLFSESSFSESSFSESSFSESSFSESSLSESSFLEPKLGHNTVYPFSQVRKSLMKISTRPFYR